MAPVRPRHRSSPCWSLLTATALLTLTALSPRAPAQGVDLFDDSVIREVRITFDDPLWYQQLVIDWCANDPNEPGATEFLSATVELAGYCFDEAQVRARGHSTMAQAAVGGGGIPCYDLSGVLPDGPRKFPLEVELGTSKPFGVDTLRLNNAVFDSSLMGEVLGTKLMGELLPGPRANWLEVLARGPSEPDYTRLGVYVNLEHMDRQFMQRIHWLGDGYRYNNAHFPASDGPGDYVPPSCSSLAALFQANPAAEGACDPADYQLIYDALPVIHDAVWGLTAWDQLGAAIDADEMTRFWAAWCLMNFDDGARGESFEDAWHGTLTLVPQGFDSLSLSATQLLPNEGGWNPGFFGYFEVQQLLPLEPFRRHYLAHVRAVAEGFLADPTLPDWIASRAAMLGAHAATPVDPHFTQLYEVLFPDDPEGAAAYIEGLLIDEGVDRIADLAAIQADILGDPALSDEPPLIESVGPGSLRVVAGQDIVVAAHVQDAQKVMLHWHDRGPFQWQAMLDNGLFPDMLAGDGIYSTLLSIPADLDPGWIEYYVEAVRAEPGGHVAAFEPPGGGQEPFVLDVSADWTSNPIRFNEFLAANKRTDVNPCHDTDDDWFELYNPGPGSYDLTGWEVELGHLDGSPGEVWTIPPSPLALLGPGEFLRIWCHPYEPGDEGVPDGKDGKDGKLGKTPTPCKQLEASFELSRKGGQFLALRNPWGLVDLVRFKRQTRDISQGRWPDGSGAWRPFTNPTGGFPNLESNYDLNGDGVVDAADGQAFIDDWYGTVCDPCAGCFADFDGDGVVTIDDFLILLGQI